MRFLRDFFVKIFVKKEEETMAVVYATLIIKGKKTLDQVPAMLRGQVEEMLRDLEVEA